MANRAYGHQRLSAPEVAQRLAMGDAGEDSNRVLHLAWRIDDDDENGSETLVGCCSSTKQTPWCPRGCGHWGLLVVDVDAQGTGVASTLVRAAERRLIEAGLQHVQIEYEYTRGDAASERLYAWYEGALGFNGGGPPGRNEFRRCRKKLARLPPDGDLVSSSAKRRAASAASACAPAPATDEQLGDTPVMKHATLRCWAAFFRMYRRLLG